MSEALKRARKDVLRWIRASEERLETARQMPMFAYGQRIECKPSVQDEAGEVAAAKAALDAIDAAIAAEKSTKDRVQVSIDFGGVVGERAGETVMSTAKAEETRVKTAKMMTNFVISGEQVEEGSAADARPIQLGDIVEAHTKFRVVGISERSTDGLNLGVSEEDGPFCQLEVQACGTTKTLELLASDLRRL